MDKFEIGWLISVKKPPWKNPGWHASKKIIRWWITVYKIEFKKDFFLKNIKMCTLETTSLIIPPELNSE